MSEEEKNQKVYQPPKLVDRILGWLLNNYVLEDVHGDLYELFQRHVALHGLQKAKWLYCRDAFRFVSPFTKKEKCQPFLM
jgi:putative ABC transport system permease protein